MIPHAITNTGSYVELWSQLKAIQHALQRAGHGANKPTELDRELLERLADMLRGALHEEKPTGELNRYFESLTSQETEGALNLDLRQNLKDTPEFDAWLSTLKLGIDKKIQRLIAALENYIQESKNGLIAVRLPDDEFKILGTVVARLLVQVESCMHA
jgi:hypothetical protein